MPRRMLSPFRNLFRKEGVDKLLDEELRSSLEILAQEKIQEGMDPGEAGRQARIELGGMEQVKMKVREARFGTTLETVWQDIRYGLRMLRKNPGFTILAVLSLALGIGANTLIFTLIKAVFLNPLPVEESSRLVSVFTTDPGQEFSSGNLRPMSRLNFLDYQEQNEVFSGMVAFTSAGLSLSIGGEPQPIVGQIVTGNYFDVLGVRAARGRTFLPEEDQTPGSHAVVVISHGLWQRQFGSDPGIIGRTVNLNGHPFEVIGVAPEGFKGTSSLANPDRVWVPMMMYDQVLTGTRRQFFDSRRALLFSALARLNPDVSLEQAQVHMATLAQHLAEEYPNDNANRSVALRPLNGLSPNQQNRFTLAGGLLMSVVGLVLLIACANVANLLLVRATAREKEVSVRLALGASRARLVRQLLTESVLLALLGGAVGFLIAIWGRKLIWAFSPPFIGQNLVDLSLDMRVLGFTLAVSVLTGVVFGMMPALKVSRPNLVEALKEGGRSSSGIRRHRLRSMFVVGEIALALVVLIVAGLFIRSLQSAQRIDPGFEHESLLLLSFDVGRQGYSPERGQQFYQQVVERVEAVSGVESATLASTRPFGGGFRRSVTPEEGIQLPAGSRGILTPIAVVMPAYFNTLHILVVGGRTFTDFDREDTLRVAVINQAMAKRFWPGQDPIGKRFKFFNQEDAPLEVIGIVEDTLLALGRPPQPIVFLAVRQNYVPAMSLHVRTTGDPQALLGTVRSQVQALDRNMLLTGVTTISQVLDQNLWSARIGAALLSVFGLLALMLATVGIYGVISYLVSQHIHEFGVRMALGAQPRDIFKLVVGQGMVLTLAGVGLGLAASFSLTRFLQSLLFDVSPTDPVTFAGVAVLLAAVALLACYIPARRATKIDPMIALRYE